jgi:hypothetical protein
MNTYFVTTTDIATGDKGETIFENIDKKSLLPLSLDYLELEEQPKTLEALEEYLLINDTVLTILDLTNCKRLI